MKKLIFLLFITNIFYAQGEMIWKKSGNDLPSSGTTWSTPLIMNGKLFWAGQDKGFVAMDAESGDILWRDTINFSNGTYDSPVGLDGKVFISVNNYFNQSARKLLALDSETGNILWQKDNFYTSNRSSKPLADDDKLYASSNDTLYCFNSVNGEVVWKKAGKYSNMLIDYNGLRLFAARADSAKIEVMYRHNGQSAWSLNLPDAGVNIAGLGYTNYFNGSTSKEYLIVAPGTSQKAIFYCVDIAAQNIVWSKDNIGYVGNNANPVIYQDKVIVGVAKTTVGENQDVVAFNLLSGVVIWQNDARLEGATNTPYAIVLDGKVFYHSSENNNNAIAAADVNNGTILWNTLPQFENEWPLVWGSPLIYKNKLYVAKDHEGVFCFNSGTVNGEWSNLGGNIYATNSFFAPLVGIEENQIDLPDGFNLGQNYPNPFNPETKINFHIPEAAHVQIKLYDLLGKEIATLVNEYKQAGAFSTNFRADNSSLTSGVYFYTLKAGNYKASKKMIYLK